MRSNFWKPVNSINPKATVFNPVFLNHQPHQTQLKRKSAGESARLQVDRVVRSVASVPGVAAGPASSAGPGQGGPGDGPQSRPVLGGEALQRVQARQGRAREGQDRAQGAHRGVPEADQHA